MPHTLRALLVAAPLVHHGFAGCRIRGLAPAVHGHAEDAEHRKEDGQGARRNGWTGNQHVGRSSLLKHGRSLSPKDVEIGLRWSKPYAEPRDGGIAVARFSCHRPYFPEA